jgi:molecular chaperone GrpE
MGTPAEQSTTEQDRDGVQGAVQGTPAQGEAASAQPGARPEGAPAQPGAAGPDPGIDRPDSDAELARLEDRWRRAIADLDNLRKRYARELDRERTVERARVVGAWLPIVDDLERAISHAGEHAGAVIDGVRNVVGQAVHVLERLGFPRDDESGVPFDPERHEVVGVVEQPDSPAGTVVDVLRPGYGTGSRQLRPAAVVVSRRGE